MEQGENTKQDKLAKKWPCASCAIFLGICHLCAATSLLVFDVATNSATSARFAISASLSFFICTILSFIAARRVDKAAQMLLFCFSMLSCFLCSVLFVESSKQVNNDTSSLQEHHPVTLYCQDGDKKCVQKLVTFHTFLICISLMEFVVCCATVIVCFRSLHQAYAVRSAKSPYSTLIIGDFNKLVVHPSAIHPSTKNIEKLLRT